MDLVDVRFWHKMGRLLMQDGYRIFVKVRIQNAHMGPSFNLCLWSDKVLRAVLPPPHELLWATIALVHRRCAAQKKKRHRATTSCHDIVHATTSCHDIVP